MTFSSFFHALYFLYSNANIWGCSKYLFIKMDVITDSMDMSLVKLWEMVKDRNPGMLHFMGSQSVGHNWMTEKQKGPPENKYSVMRGKKIQETEGMSPG